jgi:hypothetical protein
MQENYFLEGSLALVPVSDIKPDHIRMISKKLVRHPMEIMLSLPVNVRVNVPYFCIQPSPLF